MKRIAGVGLVAMFAVVSACDPADPPSAARRGVDTSLVTSQSPAATVTSTSTSIGATSSLPAASTTASTEPAATAPASTDAPPLRAPATSQSSPQPPETQAPTTAAPAPATVSTTRAPATTTAPQATPAGGSIGSCPVFPANSYWHADVSGLPVHANSAAYVASIGSTASLKADFGSGLWEGGPIGIPYVVVGGDQPKSNVNFEYADESDPGPYPIPPNPPIEGGSSSSGDRHILMIDTSACRLYELFSAYPNGDGSWRAGSGAIFDLRSNAVRPAGWTSADAAGLPIFAGLVRYDEVAAGAINHAIRITVPRTQKSYVWPARHYASSRTDTNLPPMGLWLRLRADFDISGFAPQVQVILRALKKHGAIVADNGSAWYMTGAPDERWNNDMLQTLRRVPGSAFEALDVSSIIANPDSGQTR